jgi:hypothetical protein
MADDSVTDRLRLTALLRDSSSATHQLLLAWTDVPLLMMLDVDWERGPLVLVGLEDLMMWPLLPPGSLLQLNQKRRKITEGRWSEFERPVYLIEYAGKFYCCYAQRKGENLLLISHDESPIRPITAVPSKNARVRGELTPIFRPLATRDTPAGRSMRRHDQ